MSIELNAFVQIEWNCYSNFSRPQKYADLDIAK